MSSARWQELTRCAAAASLLPVGVYALSAAHDDRARAADRDKRLLGGVICLVAAAVYAQMGGETAADNSALRCADWLVTCPLLVLEMFVILEAGSVRAVASPRLALAMAASAAMVLVGWGADPSLPRIGAAFALLLVVAVCLAAAHQRDTKRRRRRAASAVVGAFFALWPLYGVVALLRRAGAMAAARAEISYNLLDIASKAAFVLVATLALSSVRG